MRGTDPMRQDPESRDLSVFLNGMATGCSMTGQELAAQKLKLAAEILEEVSWHRCGQGYVDCNGGQNCCSDHK